MPSRMQDPQSWPLDGCPISNDSRSQDYSPKSRRARRSGHGKRGSGCAACSAMALEHRRTHLRACAVLFEDAVKEGENMLMFPLEDDHNCDKDGCFGLEFVEGLGPEEAATQELRRLGLVYDDVQVRGSGVSWDVITPAEQEFSVSYKPLRGSRRRQAGKHRAEPQVLSPALSYVDITSDEELAAFLSVYDFVDVAAEGSVDGGFELV